MESGIAKIIEEQVKAGISEDPNAVDDEDLDLDDLSFDDEDED